MGWTPRHAPRHEATCYPRLLGAGGLELAPVVATGHAQNKNENVTKSITMFYTLNGESSCAGEAKGM